jgi:protein-S-isoprenylcysteine O-methyltransferase Ste14
MYLGMAVMLFAPALWLGAPVFMIAPVVFLAVIATIFVPFEEKRLTEEYGAEFSVYKSRVRRWI